MSILKKLSIAFLVLLTLLIGGITLLLTTSSGIQFTLNTVVRFVPGLSIAQIEGNWRHLTLTNTQFEMPGVKVGIERIFLSLDLSCLRQSQLCSDKLALQNIQVMVDTTKPPASEQPPATQLDKLVIPYPIFLRDIELDNVHVAVDQMTFGAKRLVTGANWQQSTITLLPAKLTSLLIELPATPQQKPSQPETKTLGEQLNTIFAQPLLASLPDVVIPLDFVVEQLDAQDLQMTGATPIILQELKLRGSLIDSELKVEQLAVKIENNDLYLRGQAILTKQWPVKLLLNAGVNTDPIKGEKIKLDLNGDLLGKLNLLLNLSGPVKANLSVATELAVTGLPLALNLKSPGAKWSLQGDNIIQLGQTEVAFSGKATDYQLKLDTLLNGAQIPESQITLAGKGNTQQFVLNQLLTKTLQGTATLKGTIDWSKAFSWDSSLTLAGINTVRQWPEWPATLNGQLAFNGHFLANDWQIELPTIDINGQIKQHNVNMQGKLKGNSTGQWDVNNLLIVLGQNRIEANGQLNHQSWALDALIDLPNLAGILPDMAGRIDGRVRLRGSQQQPEIKADITGNKLIWQTMTIDNATLTADISSAQQVQGDIKLDINRLIQDEIFFKQITLLINGNERNHQLTLNADGKPISSSLLLNGRFDRVAEIWRGTLTQAGFTSPIGEITAQQPISINYQHQSQTTTISSHCWLNTHAELCVPRPIEIGANGNASILLKRLDLAMLKPLLHDFDLKGIITGQGDINWAKNGGTPRANLTIESNNIQMKARVDDAPLPLNFDRFTLTLHANPQSFTTNWLLSIAKNGEFRGNINVAHPSSSRVLSGNIVLDKLSLADLQPLLTRSENITGNLNGDLQLAGNLKRPQVIGRIDLSRLNLDLQVLPITIKDSFVNLSFHGLDSVLAGEIRTEKGYLALNGDADWHNIDAWRANITAKGDQIRVMMPPMVNLDVSPDLHFTAAPEQLTLTGNVVIPWARITVEDLPESVVAVSPDEVILNNDLQPVKEQRSAIPIVTDLAVKIGNQVTLNAFGLQARLQGALRVLQDQRGLGLHGQIDIPSGSFRAYGQALVIRKGQLIFAGLPDQPRLNIEAIRDPDATEDGVTAGLRITGLADQPQLDIFSDPAMSQEQALSYLLRGQGLDSRGEDGAMMTSMLVGMGVAQSGRLVGKIGETFGVKNLTLDTQGVGDSSQVVVSGYVLPDLQVMYGVGIFDSLATLTLRYRVMPRLYLQAVSGLDQALDLLYQFEF